MRAGAGENCIGIGRARHLQRCRAGEQPGRSLRFSPFLVHPGRCPASLNCFQAPPRGQFRFCPVSGHLFPVHLPSGPLLSRAEKWGNNRGRRCYHSSPATLTSPQGTLVRKSAPLPGCEMSHSHLPTGVSNTGLPLKDICTLSGTPASHLT